MEAGFTTAILGWFGTVCPRASRSMSGASYAPERGSAANRGQQITGVGDIAFRLQWEGAADLDLLVVEPSGEKVWFGARRSSTGGVLDVDCNFVTICPHPVENVFWAKGTAPSGIYRFQVGLANTHGAAFPIPFTVMVLHGRRAVTTERGEIRRLGEVWGPQEAVWR